jgi:hypothetical protein
MPNESCGITRNNQFEPWPTVKLAALRPVSIPYLTPEERGDSQPYPDPKPYYKPSDWMVDSDNYAWPGVVAIW